jgi:hypothetical protein
MYALAPVSLMAGGDVDHAARAGANGYSCFDLNPDVDVGIETDYLIAMGFTQMGK